MKKFIISILLLSICLFSYGEDNSEKSITKELKTRTISKNIIEEFEKVMDEYLLVQNENPNHIIRYNDKNGWIARNVLNPSWGKQILIISEKELNSGQKIINVSQKYKLVVKNYIVAFESEHGIYDQEFLDSIELMYFLYLAGIRDLMQIDSESIQDDIMKEMILKQKELGVLGMNGLLAILKESIEKNEFSPGFKPNAQKKFYELEAGSKKIISLIEKTNARKKAKNNL